MLNSSREDYKMTILHTLFCYNSITGRHYIFITIHGHLLFITKRYCHTQKVESICFPSSKSFLQSNSFNFTHESLIRSLDCWGISREWLKERNTLRSLGRIQIAFSEDFIHPVCNKYSRISL